VRKCQVDVHDRKQTHMIRLTGYDALCFMNFLATTN
jgi:hypothetical protein